MYGADATLSAVGERLHRDSRSNSAVDGSNEHTSTRAHEHTSTRAHDTQPIPPQKNLTIRGNTVPATAQKYVTNTPRCASLPRHTATQASTVGSIIPAARTEARRTRHAAPQKRLTTNQRAQTVVHYTPNTPCHPDFTEVDCTLSNHPGGFATIDPRHADDTPQRSAYGSNSPQATNENKPHHHNKHTKTSRTRPTQPPKEHTTPALPSNHAGDFATIDPSTGTQRWPFRPSTRGVLRPLTPDTPTTRRNAAPMVAIPPKPPTKTSQHQSTPKPAQHA